jgi:hypothetical protein
MGQFLIQKVRFNEVFLYDSWFGLGAVEIIKYFDVSMNFFYFKPPLADPTQHYASSYLAVYFIEDETVLQQERRRLSLFDIFAEIGGIVEVLTIVVFFLIGST